MDNKVWQWIVSALGWVIWVLGGAVVALIIYIWADHARRLKLVEKKIGEQRVLIVRVETLLQTAEKLLERNEAMTTGMFEKMERYHCEENIRIDNFIAAILQQR